MAPGREGIPPLRERGSQENRFTVMIMRSVGDVRSFKISPRILFWAFLFLIAYLVVSIVVINSYIRLRQVSSLQDLKITQLTQEKAKTQKRLDRSRQHIALLEDYVRNLEEQGQQETRETASPPVSQPAAKTARVVEPEEAAPETAPQTAEVVDIKDMVIQKEGPRMTVNFKLVNLNPGENAVGGYIHIIATGKGSQPPQEWSYPSEKIEKGLPVNYRRGLLFLIQRFKPIQGRFNLETSSSLPSIIRILVYDQAGSMILNRTFEVNNVS